MLLRASEGPFWAGFVDVVVPFWKFRGHFLEVWASFWKFREQRLGGRKRSWAHVRLKGRVLNVTFPFWPRKLVPGAPPERPRGPENRPKKLRNRVEEAISTEKCEILKNKNHLERNAWFWWPRRDENRRISVPKWRGRREK